MPQDGLNSGVSQKLSFTDATGTLLFTTAIESFQWKPDITVEKFVGVDTKIRHAQFFMGGSGSFRVARTSSVFEDYYLSTKNTYTGNGNQIDATITQTITNADGTITQLQFSNCVLKLDDGGDWTGTSIVKQNMSFMFADLNKLT